MAYFNCMLVGDWGTGKTTAALTAPPPVLVLDVDNKLHKMINAQDKIKSGKVIQWPISERLSTMGLRRLATADPKPASKLAVERPKGYLQLVSYIEKLEDSKCIIDGQKIGTIVLDSYTSTDEHIRRLLMAVNGTNTVTQPLFGALLSNFEELNNTLLRLPANVIFICHEKVSKDELTGKITIKPLIQGSMSQKIGKDFEECYAMMKVFRGRDAKYEMWTVGDSMRSCRTSRLLPAIVEPNFSKIYK